MRKLRAHTAQMVSQCDYLDVRPAGRAARAGGICQITWATLHTGWWPLMFVYASFLWRIWLAVCALLALLISLSTPVYAQDPSPATAPVPLPARPPPSFQEQLLAPIPTQFDWIQREVRPNPMLETLLTLQGRSARLLMSASLAEEYSDNFSQGGGDANGSDE